MGGTGTPNGNDGSNGSAALTLNYLGGTVTGFTNLGSAPFDGVTSGADTITGTGFGDLIISLTGNDFVNADSGADTVYGGAGTDQLFGGIDNDTLFGGSGDDFINGQTEDDTVEGGLGNDTLEGGSNTAAGDTLSFANFIAVSGSLGITVNLDNAAQQNTGAGLDTITGFENVTGSAFDDTITGSYGGAVNNILNGMGGNDTIVMYDGYFSADHFNGGANLDTLLADKNWGSGVIFNMSLGTTTLFANSFNTFEQIENITVGGYAQVIGDGFDNVITVTQTGSAKTNTLNGGGGDDTIEGAQGADILNGDGNGLFGDTVSYSQSAAGVTVNLTVAIQGGGGDAAGDTLSGFENVTGSANNDTIAGNAGANVLKGEAGTGDTLNYTDLNGFVNVNLQTRIVSGGHAAGDTISGFENLTGSAFGDTLTGSNLANLLAGGNGNDRLFGGIGSDVLNGGDNNDTLEGGIDGDQLNGGLNTDTASYSRSTAGVTVNLLTGAATLGDAAGDSFNSIENLRGSNHGDRLTLSNVAGRADGLNGDDVMSGGTAADRLFGGNNNDVIAGRKGADLFQVAAALTALCSRLAILVKPSPVPTELPTIRKVPLARATRLILASP